jgi:thiol-disulfide isomerase/thioredoxin
MHTRIDKRISLGLLLLTGLILAACSPLRTLVSSKPSPTPTPATPEWLSMPMTDVITGQTFSMHDFSGKVVLVETMATWCPTCWKQENEIKRLQGLLNNSPDLVLVSLDVDTNEDAATLKDFATTGKYAWRFAVTPLLIARALGNLYSADYLNPPLAPMLFIDRQGSVYGLPNGVKNAESLQKTLAPYLNP